MLKQLRIGPKLLLAPGVVLALLLMLAGAAWYGMGRQHASLENMVQVRAARLEAAAALASDVAHAHAGVYQLLAWNSASFSRTRIDALYQDIARRQRTTAAALDALAGVGGSSERSIIDASAAALAAYRASVGEAVDMARVDQSLATSAMQKAENQFAVLGAHLAQLSALEKQLSMTAFEAADAEFSLLLTTMAVLVLLSIACSLLVSLVVRRAMLADIGAIADVVDDLAHGRLAAGAGRRGGDEIAATARALDRSIVTLGRTMRSVLAAVASIDTASREIASGNQDLSDRTELQASSLEETASAMATLTAAVAQNAASARSASDLAAGAAVLAMQGGEAVSRAVLTMDQIKGSSCKIAEIIGVMDAISFQTNILALNASVEAARAGPQGRGFAVVAAEVRTLAQRSAHAASQVRKLIAASATSIEAGHASFSAAGDNMHQIVTSVRQVSDIIGRISAASSAQAEGIAEVNLVVGQMDGMTQQNAALVEQAAAAAASLHDQSCMLVQAVSVFEIGYREDAPAGASEDDAMAAHLERRAPASAMRALAPSRKRSFGHGKTSGWREA